MDGETILQVKVKRGDVYDAVRNLLLNEFKVMPADLLQAVGKKIDLRTNEAVKTVLEQSWGMNARIDRAIEDAVKRVERKATGDMDRLVREVVERVVRERLTETVLARILPENKL